jgi:uncharacterized repeat protein (TIGR03803 family)
MRSKVQRGSWIWRVQSTALALVVLLLAVVATPWAQAQTYSVLYSFTGETDGEIPFGGLVRDAAGHLYGTTYTGGASRVGTVFKVSKGGKETLLHTFLGLPDGAYPQAGLIRDAAGNLYGTTSIGGSNHCGTVFKLDTTGKETVLYSFCSVTKAEDGRSPVAGLIRDAAGNLYGTTLVGGTYDQGVVFKLDTNGKETVLHTFGGGLDGGYPYAGLIRDAAGNIYGTTVYGGGTTDDECFKQNGGDMGCGTVFKLDRNNKETILYRFTGTGGDGRYPYAGLIRDATGNLYGTTMDGGIAGCTINGFTNCGTVFKLDINNKESILYSFTGGWDGGNPQAGLVRDLAGNLYGTTWLSGANGVGTVFMLDSMGKETVLHSFTGGWDGSGPAGSLVRDEAGNLYGTTYYGGDLSCRYRFGKHIGCGVVFKLTP